MKLKIYSVFTCVLFFASSAFSSQKEWVSLSKSNPEKCKPELVSSVGNQSEVSLNLPGFYKQEVQTPHGSAFAITIPGGAKMLEAGMPDLPQLSFSLIIPDGDDMKAEVISSNYTDYTYSIAPSKGNLKRDINPSQVPYTYSAAYSQNDFYPSGIVTLRDPYILRDFRGQTVVVHPFQYNPVTQTLRVYYSLTLKVSPSGNRGMKNVYHRQGVLNSVDPVYSSVYKTQFINYQPLSYTPLFERGNMLVIADATLMSTMQPFVNWKNRMGQKTEMVDVATIGTNPTDIKSYIENYYNTNGLTFVLLVGDAPQIPTYPSANGDSDPSYGYILGNDSYAEVFVGRFSANDVDELQTQVERSVSYEMYPDPNGQWYHKGVCIGSDQGPGDDNEMDFEHERSIRTDYLGYNYTSVDELYDGSQGIMDAGGNPNPSDLVTSLNDGRSVITYTGHGSSSSFGTTGFGSSNVALLSNFDELPFIWSVACVNGDFVSHTCLAESFMRSKATTGKATGSIATFMSTINQSWNPPMDAQDEMVDLLVELYPGNVKHTFGGLSVNGCMHMNDQYGTAGDEMTDTWTIFGDPSLMVRTNTPFPLAVSHASTIDETATTFLVNCTQDQAQVCLSLHNQIVAVSWSLVGSAIMTPSGLHAGDTLDLVVTAYNAIPYFGHVIVMPASTTGIGALSNQSFSLYPNPGNGKISIQLMDYAKDLSIKVIDNIGQTISTRQCSSEGNNLYHTDLSSLAQGIYTLVIYNEDEIFGVEKLLIR